MSPDPAHQSPISSPANGTAAAAGEPAVPSDKSLGELLGDLSTQLSALIHHEITLAKVELSSKGRTLGVGVGVLGAAGVFGILALGALVACAIAAIAQVLNVWLAALIVGGALLILAALLALIGRSAAKRATPPLPEAAVESTKEDVKWLKSQMSSAKP